MARKRLSTEKVANGIFRFNVHVGEHLVYRSVKVFRTAAKANQAGKDWPVRKSAPPPPGRCEDCENPAEKHSPLCAECYEFQKYGQRR